MLAGDSCESTVATVQVEYRRVLQNRNKRGGSADTEKARSCYVEFYRIFTARLPEVYAERIDC
jgi:hypothetical protein